MAVTTEQIKQLREATGAGISDCKNALVESDGDVNKAMDYLREKGLAMATKRAARVASDGVIDLYSHGNGRVGVMVEVNSETDFVARSDAFRNLAHEIALQIAASHPLYIKDEDVPASVLEHEKEIAGKKAKEEGKPDAIIPKIVEGSLKKFMDENVLLRQSYIRDETITVQELVNQNVAALGENIVIRRFVRWSLGESTETNE